MASRSRLRKKVAPEFTPALTQNVVQSRSFAPPSKSEIAPTLADVQAQLDHAQHFGHHLVNFANAQPQSTPIIQAKLTIGAPGDKYEQEADRVAGQVVQQLQSPQVESPHGQRSVQRESMPEEDELQMKPLADQIQRVELPDDDELQMKSVLQRETDPEEEDELQMKPMALQRSPAGAMNASADLEGAIAQARGSGSPLADTIRQPMEQAFGADFSNVTVHTDPQSDQLNRSIQAKAFTTGQDIFFRQGAYHPGTSSGQELLAHELTHVVQQNGGAVMRSPVQPLQSLPFATDMQLRRQPIREEGRADAGLTLAGNTMRSTQLSTGATTVSGYPISQVSGVSVLQRAGTKPNTASKDGKYRIKLSSEREKFSYNARGALGLDQVLPGHYKVLDKETDDDGNVTKVKIQGDEWVTLKDPIPDETGDKKLLVIDTVGYKGSDPKDKKVFLDIKIGHFTKSGQQFKLEGAGWFMRRFKQIEHDLKDLWRTSDKYGYDIDAGNLNDFNEAKESSPGDLKAAMGQVFPSLRNIEFLMRQAPVTFVGSSVFIVFNLTKPAASEVKVIDPDHPIVLSEDPSEDGIENIPGNVMTKDRMSGGRKWKEYSAKWQGNYESGMKNFKDWYIKQYNELPED